MESLYLSLHLDQFPAQAHVACNPRARSKPFVVLRQSGESHKSLVYACSQRARELGIRPGTPFHAARRRASGLGIVYRNEEVEQALSRDVQHVLNDYTPEAKALSDGTYLLDLSGTPVTRGRGWRQVTEEIRSEIRFKTQLAEVCGGVSRNRLLAVLLAVSARPDRIVECPPGEEAIRLASLDVGLLPGLSQKCRDGMKKYGLKEIGQVQRLGRSALAQRFGQEGERLYSMSLGISPGQYGRPKPSPVRAETVLTHDINDLNLLKQTVKLTSDKLCYALRCRQLKARGLTFRLTYTDRRKTQRYVEFPPSDELSIIGPRAVQTFRELNQRRVAIRSVELIARRTQVDSLQLDLFESGDDQRRRRLGEAVTDVRDRMGFGTVVSASYFGALN